MMYWATAHAVVPGPSGSNQRHQPRQTRYHDDGRDSTAASRTTGYMRSSPVGMARRICRGEMSAARQTDKLHDQTLCISSPINYLPCQSNVASSSMTIAGPRECPRPCTRSGAARVDGDDEGEPALERRAPLRIVSSSVLRPFPEFSDRSGDHGRNASCRDRGRGPGRAPRAPACSHRFRWRPDSYGSASCSGRCAIWSCCRSSCAPPS